MKKTINISLMILLLGLFSCENYLEKEPLDIISEQQVWNDPNLIRATLVNLYQKAPTRRMFNGGFPWGNDWDDKNGEGSPEPGFYTVLTDESTASYSWVGSKQINKEGLTRNSPYVHYWDYGLIRACNEFITKIDEGNVNEQHKKSFKAEARFIRAFAYFELVKRYGGVPIITKPQTLNDPHDELYPVRNSEKEVYDFILQECQEISELLPLPADIESGRANKYVALSLVSRAALYAGSIAKYGHSDLDGILGINADPNIYFKKSLDASNTIITEGFYTLYNGYADKADNYQHLFLDHNNPEVIFKRGFDGTALGHSFDFFNVVHGLGSGWGSYLNPTLELIDAYEMKDGSDGTIDWNNAHGTLQELFANKDPRMHGTVTFNGNSYGTGNLNVYIVESAAGNNGVYKLQDANPGTINTYTINGVPTPVQNVGKDAFPFVAEGSKTGFYIKKFINYDDLRVPKWQSPTDWIEFRLAEILLNKAEAAQELGQGGALEAINMIRGRAGIAPVASVDMDKIRHERRIELAFETHRMFDMRRWRIAGQVMNKVFHGIVPVLRLPENTYSYRKNCADNREDGINAEVSRYFNIDKMYYFPLGETLINNNPNLKENPNY